MVNVKFGEMNDAMCYSYAASLILVVLIWRFPANLPNRQIKTLAKFSRYTVYMNTHAQHNQSLLFYTTDSTERNTGTQVYYIRIYVPYSGLFLRGVYFANFANEHFCKDCTCKVTMLGSGCGFFIIFCSMNRRNFKIRKIYTPRK